MRRAWLRFAAALTVGAVGLSLLFWPRYPLAALLLLLMSMSMSRSMLPKPPFIATKRDRFFDRWTVMYLFGSITTILLDKVPQASWDTLRRHLSVAGSALPKEKETMGVLSLVVAAIWTTEIASNFIKLLRQRGNGQTSPPDVSDGPVTRLVAKGTR
jgi:hypothetical protein